METPYSNPRIPNTRNLESDTITFPDGSEFTTATKIQDDTTSVSVNDSVPTVNFTIGGGLSGQFLPNRLQVPEIRAPNSNGLKLYNDGGNDGIFVADNGRIGLGTTTPNCVLDVRSGTAGYVHGANGFEIGSGGSGGQTTLRYGISGVGGTGSGTTWSGNYNAVQGHNTVGVSIIGRGMIISNDYLVSLRGYFAPSDKRIKQNERELTENEATTKLKQLRPLRYGYKDVIGRGSQEVYGFFAQDVSNVIPEAINHHIDYVPDIYEFCDVSNNNISLSEYDVSNNLQVGDEVKLYIDENDEDKEIEARVESIDASNNQITTDVDLSGNVFVYGKKVNDYHVLKKESIFTLTTASVIELINRVETLEARLTALETQ